MVASTLDNDADGGITAVVPPSSRDCTGGFRASTASTPEEAESRRFLALPHEISFAAGMTVRPSNSGADASVRAMIDSPLGAALGTSLAEALDSAILAALLGFVVAGRGCLPAEDNASFRLETFRNSRTVSTVSQSTSTSGSKNASWRTGDVDDAAPFAPAGLCNRKWKFA